MSAARDLPCCSPAATGSHLAQQSQFAVAMRAGQGGGSVRPLRDAHAA